MPFYEALAGAYRVSLPLFRFAFYPTAGISSGQDLNNLRPPRFRRDLVQSIGSSGLVFAITLVSTPLMTRIFPAEAYGINGMLMTAATLLSTFGLFGLPAALAREQSSSEQTRLINAAVQLALILVFVCLLGVGAAFFFSRMLPSGLTVAVALLFPVLVLAHAAQRVTESLFTARGLFPPLAVGRIANAAITRGLTLGVGWMLHAGAAVMMIGDVIGKVGHLTVVARRGALRPDWRNLRLVPDFIFLRGALSDYRDFALHSNIAAALPLVTGLALQILIGMQLGTSAMGQFVLAQSILSLPVSLIAMASAPVVFHRLVRAATEAPAKLIPLTLQIMLGYASLGIVLMLPITLFGPTIFAFVFGESWRPAGAAASQLSLPQMLAFSLTALLSIFRVMHRIKAWLAFELAGTALVVGGVVLLPATPDLADTVGRLALLGLGYQILLHVGLLWALRKKQKFTPPN